MMFRSNGKQVLEGLLDFTFRTNIMLEFKTTSSGGVMLYATDRRKTDTVSLFMKDGYLVFAFDCGSGMLYLQTDKKYNDGKWHSVEFGRNQKTGKISVDGGTPQEGLSPGPTRSLNVRTPYFVGGITPQLQSHEKVKKHLQVCEPQCNVLT